MKYNIRYLICFFICGLCILLSNDCYGQGKITRHIPEKKVTFRRMDQLNNEVAYRAEGSNGKYGVIDRNDKLILPCKFTWVAPFFENRSYVRLNKDGKEAIINERGEFITDYIYDTIWGRCKDGRICVGIKDEQRPGYFKFGIIDKDGNQILPLIYGMPSDSNGMYYDGKVKLSLNGKDIWFDREGNEIK